MHIKKMLGKKSAGKLCLDTVTLEALITGYTFAFSLLTIEMVTNLNSRVDGGQSFLFG